MLEHAPLLRRALVLNACFSAGTGLALTLAREPLGAWLGLEDTGTLLEVGLVLLVFAAHLAWASRRRIPSLEALYFVTSDVLWVAGTAALMVAFPGELSSAGQWSAVVVAVLVGALAWTQWIGWRRARSCPV
jgi:hypothetical protein